MLDEKWVNDAPALFFNPDYWQSNNAIEGTAQGRGTTWFIKFQEHSWVLKHYYRGGLIGKLIKDHYLFTGIEQTRAVQEFCLLRQLNDWHLPVPSAIACLITKHGICYQADIISSRIQNAKDLVSILQEQQITEQTSYDIGAVIGQFHRKGVYHHDLNIHNILIDTSDKVWLIDFDRGEIRTPVAHWQQANIDRLKRSFDKEQARLASFHWQPSNWQALIKGYQTSLTA